MMPENSLRPIYWDGDAVAIVDQRVLPHKDKVLLCTKPQQVINAIKNMSIRGAPAVGMAGAMAMALGAQQIGDEDLRAFRRKFDRLRQRVETARPTGYNLVWAVEQVYSVLVENEYGSVDELRGLIRQKVDSLIESDIADNKAIGAWGKEIIPKGARVLTYCNAGALATADYGTALGVIRAAFEVDSTVQAYACETRPFLQGCRLTAYELIHEKIPTTLITDNSVGSLMQQKKVDVVVVGADRIAANGDVANKIGTYMVAVLAKTNDVPFYVAAPRSTIDPGISDGGAIPIEERDPKEITHFCGRLVAPKDAIAYNPAFDVTPHKYVTGIITEVGILRKPLKNSIRKALQSK
jgi:methylthioribose-1-phosphate isomerase